MSPSTQTQRDLLRLQHVSRWLARFCRALVFLLPLALWALWAFAGATTLALGTSLSPDAVHGALDPWQRWAGGALATLPLALWLVGVHEARRCFQQFADGTVFTGDAVRRLRRFATWTLASVALGILCGPLLSVLLTLHNAPGTRLVVVGLGSNQFFMLFFAGMVWLMAAVIGQGEALAEENARFV